MQYMTLTITKKYMTKHYNLYVNLFVIRESGIKLLKVQHVICTTNYLAYPSDSNNYTAGSPLETSMKVRKNQRVSVGAPEKQSVRQRPVLLYPIGFEDYFHGYRHGYLCLLPGRGTQGDRVCVAQEDYLGDGLNKTDAIVSSLDLNQAVAEIIPVVFPLAKEGSLLFLVKLRDTSISTFVYRISIYAYSVLLVTFFCFVFLILTCTVTVVAEIFSL